MKLPSFEYLEQQAGKSFSRFTLPLLISFLGALVFCVMVASNFEGGWSMKILATCILAMPLALGCNLYAERADNKKFSQILNWLVIVFAVLYCYTLAPSHFFEQFRKTLIYFVLLLVMHLWVAAAAYLRVKETGGFWRFNETLYIRMLLALVFSAAIYSGLALGLFACHILLKFDFNDRLYIELWGLVMGVFNTWFFVAGVPDDYETLNTDVSYPKSLKIFTQYILIPLVVLYLAILYSYGGRILLDWELPKGWVSVLIIFYEIFGLLAILLTAPLRSNPEMKWVNLFAKYFFRASIPLIFLLYIAIGARIGEYGITENRYYLFVLGAWIGCIALYFLFSRQKDIKVIPISLGSIGILTLFGPWSAFSISERSQLNRLERILVNNKIWKPGTKNDHATVAVSGHDADQISGVISYFIERKQLKRLQRFYVADLDSLQMKLDRDHSRGEYYYENQVYEGNIQQELEAILFLKSKEAEPNYLSNIDFRLPEKMSVDIAGWSKMVEFSDNPSLSENEGNCLFVNEGDSSFKLIFRQQDTAVVADLQHGSELYEQLVLTQLISNLRKKGNGEGPTPSELRIEGKKAAMVIQAINLKNPKSNLKDEPVVNYIRGWILLK